MFVEIAIIVIVAAVLAFLFERIRQPTILAYLFAGFLVAWWGKGHDQLLLSSLQDMGKVGVVLLLFLVGMELSVPRVKSIGKVAVIIGVAQIIIAVAIGWWLAYLGGHSVISSLYLAVAMAFSSTVVVVKLFGEQKTLHSLHGRIAVGFLLVQDMAAILILVLLSAFRNGDLSWMLLGLTVVKTCVLFAIVWWLSAIGLPYILKRVTMSAEVLFLLSVAWGLGIAALMTWRPIGFTIEAGGFLAGMMLANTLQHGEILSRMRPLRDFFVMLFFVVLAIEMWGSFDSSSFSYLEVFVYAVFVLIGNPLIVLILMWVLGYRSRTGFLVSLSVAQVSEFSLILVGVGHSIGHVDSGVMGMITILAVSTFLISGYLIMHSQKIWLLLASTLRRFERKHLVSVVNTELNLHNHAVLIGCHRTGRLILRQLQKLEIPTVVLDYNPTVAERLESQGVVVVLGDLEDVEVYESVAIDKAAMVISTVNDFEGNKLLLEYLQVHGKKGQAILLTASTISEADWLYDHGAHYVTVPRMVSGWHVGQFIQRVWEEGRPEDMKERAIREWNRLVKATDAQ